MELSYKSLFTLNPFCIRKEVILLENLFMDQDYDYIGAVNINGNVEVFEFSHSSGTIKHQFLKREIPVKVVGKTYYDLITPIHYGGPIISDSSEEDKWELIDEFQRAFQAYCEENNIISELVYFNPLLSNMADFVCCYEVEFIEEAKLNYLSSKISENIGYELYIGKKVWNPEVYEEACRAVKVGTDGDFFPAYRRKDQDFSKIIRLTKLQI